MLEQMLMNVLKAFGVTPEIMQGAVKMFADSCARVERIEAQLTRVEHNTLMLVEGAVSAPAGPTDYNLAGPQEAWPQRLPAFNGEGKAQ